MPLGGRSELGCQMWNSTFPAASKLERALLLCTIGGGIYSCLILKDALYQFIQGWLTRSICQRFCHTYQKVFVPPHTSTHSNDMIIMVLLPSGRRLHPQVLASYAFGAHTLSDSILMRIEIVRSGIWLIRLPTPICGPFGTHIR